MKRELVWLTCQDWQEYINSKEISVGQPVLKEDLKSKQMTLEERATRISYAYPANGQCKKGQRRTYLPMSFDQVFGFILNMGLGIKYTASENYNKLTIAEYKKREPIDIVCISGYKDWFTMASYAVEELVKKGRLK